MEWWEKFEQLEYSNELLLAAGCVLFLVGVIKIVRSSLKMFFWVVLCSIGVGMVTYATDGKGLGLPFNQSNELSEYVVSGKELTSDLLESLCLKREADGLLQSSGN